MDTNLGNFANYKINTFLNKYESTNTKYDYKLIIDSMFMYILGKEINNIDIEDILSIDVPKVKKYRDYLKSKKKTDTANREISVCKSLWKDLIEDGITNFNPFDIKKIISRKEPEHYGSLTPKELEQLYDYCLTQKKGMTKKLYFEFLVTMTCRKHVAQELKFEDIKRKLDKETKEYYWIVDSFDKTREVNRAIPEDLYNRLKENFESYDKYDQKKGFLFNISDKTLETTLKEFCEYAGIDKKGRNIVQHSLKSTGLDIIQETFGDINITAKAGGHKSIQTIYKRYINKNDNYYKQPAIVLNKNYNIDMISELSKEQLLDLINSCGQNTLAKCCIEADRQEYISLNDGENNYKTK